MATSIVNLILGSEPMSLSEAAAQKLTVSLFIDLTDFTPAQLDSISTFINAMDAEVVALGKRIGQPPAPAASASKEMRKGTKGRGPSGTKTKPGKNTGESPAGPKVKGAKKRR
jgi:hypothetical protein